VVGKHIEGKKGVESWLKLGVKTIPLKSWGVGKAGGVKKGEFEREV